MMSAEPLSSWKFTVPVPLTPTVTRLGTVWPATKFRFDASGGVAPVGHTVTWLATVGLVTVTFITTASTPLAGTFPRLVTCRVRVDPPTNGDAGVPLPVRES